jgi:two-component system, LytTR family, sensor kinase
MTPSADTTLDRFFADKSRAFWLLQFGGWGGYALLRFLNGLSNKMGVDYVGPTLIATVAGFSLTLIMAAAFRRLVKQPMLLVWSLAAPLVIVSAGIFSAIEVWGHATFYESTWQPQGLEFLGVALFDLYVLTTWAALYFGINYYLALRIQSNRMLTLAADAHKAQLKMLRYQLNPHFLFNTLNSISTLVLVKDTARANAMLTRLSAFLRYSLVGEPTQTVTVSQELEALRLYLDIERMRFEDRLRVVIDVDAEVAQAQLPSLLLQPLVENAIKYGVAPAEEGATLTLGARQVGNQLHLMVADTGPGFAAGQPAFTEGQTGVGLGNIRERLRQFYGDDQSFRIGPNSPHGVRVDITLPLQTQIYSEVALTRVKKAPS